MSPGAAVTACTKCDTHLDECAFCDEADCGVAICYGCLNVDLGQEIPQPHAHGG